MTPAEPPMKTLAVDAALGYATNGWYVHPLRVCLKSPATFNGFEDATLDLETIKAWWADTHVKIGQSKETDPNDSTKQITTVHYTSPDLNLGIATGKKSGLVVIDIDPDKGGSVQKLQDLYGELPETLNQITGSGGRHLLYRYPEGINYIKCSQSVLAPGIDVRADGGYICAPPSVHPDGPRYEWANSETALAELPTSLLQAMLEGKKQKATKAEAGGAILKGRPGGRCGELIRLAGGMRHQGFTFTEIKAAIETVNITRCKPPLTEAELHAQVFNGVAKWPAGDIKDSGLTLGEHLSTVDLMNKQFAERQFVLDEILQGTGFALLADRPKQGKSWLALQLACDVAAGELFLDRIKTVQKRVLYFALEDSEQRIQERMKVMNIPKSVQANIDFNFELKLTTECVAAVDAVLEKEKADGRPYGFIVIDTWLKAAPPRSFKSDPVKSDYNDGAMLADLARRHGLALLVVHHTRKPLPADPASAFDQILGTTGMTASPDALIMLTSTKTGERVLKVTGKDVTIEHDLELEFSKARISQGERPWKCLGRYNPALTGDQSEVYKALEQQPDDVRGLAKRLNRSDDSLRKMLSRMANTGLVETKDGKWHNFPVPF